MSKGIVRVTDLWAVLKVEGRVWAEPVVAFDYGTP